MKYTVQHTSDTIDIIRRLLEVRGINDSIDNFLSPDFASYRQDPFFLKDMDIATDIIIKTMQEKKRIMIFGDYDVDGISSSFIVYTVCKEFFNYDSISIQFPDRLEDGYGLKNKHIDMMIEKGVDLIITVDNGITSVQEAAYAREKNIDLIITDHHEPGDIIPDALAVINPKLSPDYGCQVLCGAGVAYKLIAGLLHKSQLNAEDKQHIMEYILPIVAIATVADIVPLVHENRVFVKKGLEQINARKNIPPSLHSFLEFVNLKKNIDSYHIGFVIGPRINAGGRIASPYHSLAILLHTGDKQRSALEELEELNTQRRKMQEIAHKLAESQIDPLASMIIAQSEEFHEGIVGIVAGRLSEKYYKPSAVFTINQTKNHATASLRGPSYFNVIQLIHHVGDLTLRSGGHKQAGGMTVSLDNLPLVIEKMQEYCKEHITPTMLEKEILIDTILHPHERNTQTLNKINILGPFGNGNEEPIFKFPGCTIISSQKIGSRGKGHCKIHAMYGEHKIAILFRGKGEDHTTYNIGAIYDVYGKVKVDTFMGGYFIDCVSVEVG